MLYVRLKECSANRLLNVSDSCENFTNARVRCTIFALNNSQFESNLKLISFLYEISYLFTGVHSQRFHIAVVANNQI